MLEDAVLDLYEAEAAGIARGDLVYHHVSVPAADIVRLTGRDAEASEAFLFEAIHMAKGMAGHWEDMLAGSIPTDGLPPVIVFRSDGPEIVDGEHRLAAMALHPDGDVRLVVGVEPGTPLADRPPGVSAWTILPAEDALASEGSRVPGF